MKIAVYPLSADPITFGHLDIIRRALKIFDKVVVAVGNNASKNYTFNLQERTEITKFVLKDFLNLQVISFDGLLTDFALQNGINFVIRGFRNSHDYLHELNLYKNYLSQNSNLEFINLFSNTDFVSSGTVKELIRFNGEIHRSVPMFVKYKLEEKILGQNLIGITGNLASGKTYIAEKLVKLGQIKNLPIKTIDLDTIGHRILENCESEFPQLFSELKKVFGRNILDKTGQISRKNLAEIVFEEDSTADNFNHKVGINRLETEAETFGRKKLWKSEQTKLKLLNSLMHPIILAKLREKLRTESGIILLQSAVFVENNLSYLFNNRIIVIDCDKKMQLKNIKNTGLSLLNAEKRLGFQLSTKEIIQKIHQKINLDGFGKIWKVNNSFDEDELEQHLTKILSELQN